MAQSTNAIQLKSDLKRGVRSKGYKLPVATIELIETLATRTGKPQSVVITEAIRMLADTIK